MQKQFQVGEFISNFPANINLFRVNNRNSRKRCEICSKLTIKTLERRQSRRSGAFIVNFEHISHLFLLFLLLALNRYMLAGCNVKMQFIQKQTKNMSKPLSFHSEIIDQFGPNPNVSFNFVQNIGKY